MKQKINSIFSVIFLLFAVFIAFPSEMNFSYAAEEESSILDSGPQQNKDVYSTCGGDFNYRSSFVFSAITLCIPGLLEKGYEWRQNKCEAAVCYYEAVKNDLDPQFCISQDGYKTCKFIVGEAFAVPPIAMLEYLRDMMANLLANPVGMAYAYVVKLARDEIVTVCLESSGLESAACKSKFLFPSLIVLTINDIASIAQTISDIAENGFFPPGIDEGENYCEKLDDIKEEIEPILKD